MSSASKRTVPISEVYDFFASLKAKYREMQFLSDNDREILYKIIDNRWNFMYRNAHGIAYLLDPRFIGKEMDHETREKVEHFIGFTYPYKAKEECCELSASAELFEWLDQMETIHDNAEKRNTLDMLFHGEISPFLWWKRQKNPRVKHLREIALMVFSLSCTSAACERVFSVMGFIHNKLRNRLLDLRVMKLLFVYINIEQLKNKRERETVDVVDVDDYYHNLDFHDYDVEQDDSCGTDF